MFKQQIEKLKFNFKNLTKSVIRSNIFISIVALIISKIIRIIFLTLRIKKLNFEMLTKYKNTGYILLFWHGRFMIPPLLIRKTGKKMFGLFSKHPDGKLIAKIFSFNKVTPIWGSTFYATPSTIRDSINILKEGHILGFTPDGPIGPRFNIATNSPFYFAMKAKVPIIPLYISAKNAKIINSWDRCMIIKPFSKVIAKLGQPILITEDDFKSKQEQIKIELQKIMISEQQKLDKECKLPLIEPETFEESRAYGKMQRIGKIKQTKI